MTPAERQLISNLFDRLATLEDAQRDPDAERAIKDGLRQAPNAVYSLVQTTLVQEEALKQAEARIRQLEQSGAGGAPGRSGSFLDGPFGRSDNRPASVPNVPMGGPGGFQTAPQPMPAGPAPAPAPQGGGSFLGTAAAAAAGAIGGALLTNALRGMTGGSGHGAGGFGLGGQGQAGGLPWGGGSGGPGGGAPGGAGGGALSRDAGIDDIGRSGGTSGQGGQGGDRDIFGGGSGSGKRGGDNESYDRGEAQAGDKEYETASAADSHESESDDAGYEDDADYSEDDADLGGDDSDLGGDDLGGGDGGTSEE